MRSNKLVIKNVGPFNVEPLEGKEWQRILDKGIDIVYDAGFVSLLGGGTLLGMIREKDHYIHHDTDLDVELMIDEYTPEIEEMFKKLINLMNLGGFELIRTQHYGVCPTQLAFFHRETKIIFDIYLYYNSWGSSGDYYNINEHGILIRPKYSAKNFEVYKFNKAEYYVPLAVEDYLEGRYKDWKTPTGKKGAWQSDVGKYMIVL